MIEDLIKPSLYEFFIFVIVKFILNDPNPLSPETEIVPLTCFPKPISNVPFSRSPLYTMLFWISFAKDPALAPISPIAELNAPASYVKFQE